MIESSNKQARIEALIQELANLKAEHISDAQLARMTEVINAASVQSHQLCHSDSLLENFLQTENLVKKLQSDIAGLQQSDLLINNEIRLLNMQQQLKAAQGQLEQLASRIEADPAELAYFRNISGANHLALTTQLCEKAQLLKG